MDFPLEIHFIHIKILYYPLRKEYNIYPKNWLINALFSSLTKEKYNNDNNYHHYNGIKEEENGLKGDKDVNDYFADGMIKAGGIFNNLRHEEALLSFIIVISRLYSAGKSLSTRSNCFIRLLCVSKYRANIDSFFRSLIFYIIRSAIMRLNKQWGLKPL